MSEPPADILRRLTPIPTHTGQPTTTPRDIVGVAPDGARPAGSTWWRPPRRLCSSSSRRPASAAGTSGRACADLQAGLAGAARLVVVTRSPGEESPEAITALAGDAPVRRRDRPRDELARPSRDYRVGGPPFLTVAAADGVRTESVAWGLEQTLQAALEALHTG